MACSMVDAVSTMTGSSAAGSAAKATLEKKGKRDAARAPTDRNNESFIVYAASRRGKHRYVSTGNQNPRRITPTGVLRSRDDRLTDIRTPDSQC